MIAQGRLRIRATAALYCGLLIVRACSDYVGPGSYESEGPRVEGWVGRYASALDTVVVDDTPNSVRAQLDLYRSPAGQLYAKFSTEDSDDWTIFHSASCHYYVERGAVHLILKVRVHYPGGNELIDASATFVPVDQAWTAVVWAKTGIMLERDVHSRLNQ